VINCLTYKNKNCPGIKTEVQYGYGFGDIVATVSSSKRTHTRSIGKKTIFKKRKHR
jgi:hypothetical protein